MRRPNAGLIFDQGGNLYGSASDGGVNNGGTVFELKYSNGSWTPVRIFGLQGSLFGPSGPRASLVMDAAGNLYGTTSNDGAYGDGSAFELTNGSVGWTQTVLHDFTNGSDGSVPFSNLVFDTSGNLYGTAAQGGSGAGVVFEIAP